MDATVKHPSNEVAGDPLYRRITALLQRVGWRIGKDRVERIWRREGLKAPKRQKPRGRLWLNDGRSVRILNLIDEHTREALLVRAERRWSSSKVIEALADVMVMKSVPEHLRSDNGPEFVARDLRQ